MKTNFYRSLRVFRYCILFSILLIAAQNNSFGQVATCNSVTTIANIGIDRDLNANTTIPNTDDWFLNNLWTGSGIGIIGTSAATAQPPLKISTADFNTMLQTAANVGQRNRTYVQRMGVSSLTVHNNMLLLDAFSARDNITSGSASDSTVFSSGGDKNEDNPSTWSIGVGGVQQKNDLVDVGGHLRRDLTTNDLWGFAYMTILAPSGDGYSDVEIYRRTPSISGGTLINSGNAAEGGHTPFRFSNTGAIQEPGDVLVSINYGSSTGLASVRIWVNPINIDGAGHDTAWLNAQAGRPFTFTGDFITGLNANGYGYAEIRSKSASSCLVYSTLNTASTPAGAWGNLSGSGANYAANIDPSQLVEIAINFTQFGLDLRTNTGDCFNVFGAVLFKTRSSSSWSSELKDLCGPFTFGNFTEVQANAGTDKIINCNSSQVTLTGGSQTPGATFSWTTSTGNIVSGATTGTPVVNAGGTYILTVVSPTLATCVARDTVIVTVDTVRASANAGPDKIINCTTGSSITLNGSSATSGGSISWTAINGGNIVSGNTSLTPTVNAAGDYILTVGNTTNGCSASDTVHVALQTALPVISSASVSEPTCNSTCNGSISLMATSVSLPLTYTWSNGANSASLSGLCAGTYTVTVTGSNGCTASASYTLTQPAVLSIALAPVNVLCSGNATGSISAIISGGTAAYSYTWSNGATTASVSGLSAGNYQLTVTDAKGCTASQSATITEPSAAVSISTSQTNILCRNNTTGIVNATANGGTGAYSFSWNNGATTSSITGLSAGNYTVTVTDANNCSATTSVTLTQPAAILTGSLSPTAVLCNGGNTGSLSTNVSGGTAPYQYNWSNGATTQNLQNISTGSYTLTVTDANGCTLELSSNVSQPAAALSVTGSTTDILCHGDNSGSINISVSGGTSPYIYNWSTAATTQDLNNLYAGSYNVTVTDNNGCTMQFSAVLTEPSAPLSVTTNKTDILCRNELSGSITANVTGGTGPYQYNWSNGANTATITGLAAGTYTVTITDNHNCSTGSTVTLTQPSAILTGTLSPSAVLCYGGNTGIINSTVNGGTTPYQYSWSNGEISQNINSLSTGAYTLTVTDANGCTLELTTSVSQPAAALSISGSTTDILCHGNNTGNINITINGGTLPYNYSWNTGSTTQDINNLVAGFYSLTVTDQNGCTAQYNTALTEPAAPLAVSASKTDILCRNDLTGAIATNVTGGTSPYQYNWSNGATTADLSNLAAGTYTVTITDNHNCSTGTTITLIQPAVVLSGTITPVAVLCNAGNTGSINSSISGGTPPYQYNWSNGAATPDINNLTAGTYTLTVTDAHGCSITLSTTVSEPVAALAVSHTQTNVLCHGNSTGAIDLTVTGGTTPYSYSWNNNAGTQDLTGIQAGAYQVTVTDQNGCTAELSTIINEPATPLTTNISCTAVKCHNGSDGRTIITASGGTAPYQYLWNNGVTTNVNPGITAGTYTVTVTDANGCTSVKSTTVSQPAAALTLSETHENLSCFSQPAGSIDLSVSGGTPAYSYNWSNGFTTQDLSGLAAGNYTVTVTDINGCSATLTIAITQPAGELNVASTLNHVNCNGGSDGQIDLTLSMGTPPYGILWSTGAVSATIQNLSAGVYTASVSDANGCNLLITNMIQEPSAPLSGTDSIIAVNCFGDATGSIYTTITGGTPPYIYSWSNGATSAEITGLTSGTYTVTVTDAQACTFNTTYSITQPSAPLTITDNIVQPNCVGINNGSIDLSVTGGTVPYAIQWSTGETTEDLNNLAPGTYTVLVTDAVNCTASATYTIQFTAAQLTATGTATAVLCHGNSTGDLTVIPAGGTTPYSYAWNTGATTATIAQLTAGTYSVTVTDINGCTTIYSNIVTEPAAALQVNHAQANINCFGDATGQINITVTDGTPGYSFLWSDGNTDEDRINLIAGTYTVTVTDNNGCTVLLSTTLTQPAAALNVEGVTTDVLCHGNNTGDIQLTVTGGTSPYIYNWSNGASTQSLQNILSGNYQVNITDNNGCTLNGSYSIAEPAASLAINSATQQVSCNGIANGAITLTVTGGTPAYTYLWSNGNTNQNLTGLVAGTYTVTVTDVNNCSQTETIALTQPQLSLNVSGTVSDANCIYGQLGNIVISPSGGTQPYSFTWSNGSLSQNLNNVLPGTYYVTVTDINGCSTGKEFMIADNSSVNVLAAGNTTICIGNMITINAQFAQPVTAALQWYYNGAPLIGATTSAFTTPVAGTYTLVATTACGSYTSNPVEVTVRSLNSVMISSEAIICPGETVQLQAGGGVEYSWSPGLGLSDSTSSNPVASPVTTTEYSVVVKDDFGCTATASVVVNVVCDTLDIPNGFSPNGDGTNDTFVIDGLSKYPENTLWIYNRWGNLVYKQRNYENNWDGRSNVSGVVLGQELPNGTYYYLLDLKLDQKPFKGFVVIRR